MLQNLYILSVVTLLNTNTLNTTASSTTTSWMDGVCQMPTDSPASQLWSGGLSSSHQAASPQGWVLLSSVLCVRMEAKFLTSPYRRTELFPASLAYPANRNWDLLNQWDERHRSKKPAQCWYYWHLKISGRQHWGSAFKVKCTLGQHPHQHKHKTDGKKRVCFPSSEPLNHAAHKYLSPHFLFSLFHIKGVKRTP